MGAWSSLPAVWSFTFNDEDGFSWRRGAARTCSRSLFGDLHRVEALPGVMVASAAGLARVFAPIGMLKLGSRKRMEAIAGACAQGAISELAKEPATVVAGEQGPVHPVVFVLVVVFSPLVGSACFRSL